MKTYTFYLRNGLTFKIKAESITTTSNIGGQITGYKISKLQGYLDVDISEVIAIVEDI